MDAHALSVLEFDAVRRHLAGEAFTEPGRREALGLVPCRDLAAARWLQDETMEMRRGVAEQGRPPVDGAGDLAKILVSARIEGHPLDPEDLLAVAGSLRAARAVLSWAGRIAWEKPRLEAVVANLRAEPDVEREISAAFDEQGKVADGASSGLRDIRRTMARLEERIRRRMDDILSRASSWLQDSFVTQRNGRWVIPVKSGSRSNVPGIVHDSSDSGATLYIEPASVVETGNDLAAAAAEERVEVRRILTALSDLVRSILPAIERNTAALAAIDLAAARARLAERLHASRAEIDDGCRVRLEGARHPLLALNGIDAVPIDLRVGDDFRILVITGPNTGGKTVALKTTGLLHLMALSGLHVPARPGARVGAFTEISADIGDEQSIEQSLSTFSAHLRRIVDLLRTAGPRTLVLLDELGAGTDPAEGGALGCAILEALLAAGSRVVATTHLTELKSFAATTPGVVNGNVLFDPETLSPLYTLEIGVPGRSNAFAIARRYGLPEPVVARAEDFLGDRQALLDRAITDLASSRDAAARDRAAAEVARSAAEEALTRAKRRIQEAVEERRSVLEGAAREAADLVGNARASVDRTLTELRSQAVEPREALKRIDQVHRGMAEKAEGLGRPGTPLAPGEIRTGLAVRVRSLGQDGIVTAIRGKGGRAAVNCSGMVIEVGFEDLVRGEFTPPVPPVRRAPPQRDPGPREIDLRGLRVEEALRLLAGEIDHCLVAGCPSVRIIHGFGTGALSQACTEWLRRHPQVEGFRHGKPEEGGGGVTIASFRA